MSIARVSIVDEQAGPLESDALRRVGWIRIGGFGGERWWREDRGYVSRAEALRSLTEKSLH